MSQLDLHVDVAGEHPPLEAVTIRLVPDHSYVKGPKGARGCKHIIGQVPVRPGVAATKPKACNRARTDPLHNLPTMNDTLALDWPVYQAAKKLWHPELVGHLLGSGLPKGLHSVLAEARCCFPTRARRDQGNHRAFIEKALGDVLGTPYCAGCLRAWGKAGCDYNNCPGPEQAEPWIPDDSWDYFEFGNLSKTYIKGERWTELLLFPNAL